MFTLSIGVIAQYPVRMLKLMKDSHNSSDDADNFCGWYHVSTDESGLMNRNRCRVQIFRLSVPSLILPQLEHHEGPDLGEEHDVVDEHVDRDGAGRQLVDLPQRELGHLRDLAGEGSDFDGLESQVWKHFAQRFDLVGKK